MSCSIIPKLLKVIMIILVSVSCFFYGCNNTGDDQGSSKTAIDYYPLKVGAYWKYKEIPAGTNQGDTTIMTISIEAMDTLNGMPCYRQKEIRGEQSDQEWYQWFHVNKDGSFRMVAMGSSPDITTAQTMDTALIPFYSNDLFLSVGSSIDVPASDDFHIVISTMSLSETVNVPVGEFTNCVHQLLSYIAIGSNDTLQIRHKYYALNVGEVLDRVDFPSNEAHRTELIEYSVQ